LTGKNGKEIQMKTAKCENCSIKISKQKNKIIGKSPFFCSKECESSYRSKQQEEAEYQAINQ